MTKADLKSLMAGLVTVPGLRTVDLDRLQLENETDEDPINLPAVYLSWNTSWEPPVGKRQEGETTLTVRVATEHYRDTEAHAVKWNEAMNEAFDLPEAVVQKLEACGLNLATDTVDTQFTNVKVHQYSFTARVVRNRGTLLTRTEAEMLTERDIIS